MKKQKPKTFSFVSSIDNGWSGVNKIIAEEKTSKGQCDLFRIVDQAMQQQKQNLRKKKKTQRNPKISQAGMNFLPSVVK